MVRSTAPPALIANRLEVFIRKRNSGTMNLDFGLSNKSIQFILTQGHMCNKNMVKTQNREALVFTRDTGLMSYLHLLVSYSRLEYLVLPQDTVAICRENFGLL